jgi:SAM-dependent methyltransferase
MKAWLWVAHRRWARRRFDLWDMRRDLIRRLAPGKTFIDVGGMFDVHGLASFLAEESDASQVVLLDEMPVTEEFQREHERRSSNVTYRHGDLHDRALIDDLGTFDLVWCTGVLYHTPHPFMQLEHLRRLCGETLVLGTRVIPEVPGLEQACLYYPEHSEAARREWLNTFGEEGRRCLGLSAPFDRSAGMAYANFWFGFSPSAVTAMLRTAGFEVLDRHMPTPFLADFHALAVEAGFDYPVVEDAPDAAG